jgi:hypothetical protein
LPQTDHERGISWRTVWVHRQRKHINYTKANSCDHGTLPISVSMLHWSVYIDLSKEPAPGFLSRVEFRRQFSTALLTVASASRISASVNLCSRIPIGPGCRTLITVSTSRSTCLRVDTKKAN